MPPHKEGDDSHFSQILGDGAQRGRSGTLPKVTQLVHERARKNLAPLISKCRTVSYPTLQLAMPEVFASSPARAKRDPNPQTPPSFSYHH